MYMDYEYIQDENHNDYIDRIIGLIQSNSQTNSMNLFIHKIIKQPEEYQILCNALYWFIKEPPIPIQQGGSDSPSLKRARTDSPEVPPAPEVLPAPAVAAVSEEATGAPPGSNSRIRNISRSSTHYKGLSRQNNQKLRTTKI